MTVLACGVLGLLIFGLQTQSSVNSVQNTADRGDAACQTQVDNYHDSVLRWKATIKSFQLEATHVGNQQRLFAQVAKLSASTPRGAKSPFTQLVLQLALEDAGAAAKWLALKDAYPAPKKPTCQVAVSLVRQ